MQFGIKHLLWWTTFVAFVAWLFVLVGGPSLEALIGLGCFVASIAMLCLGVVAIRSSNLDD